MGPTYTTSDPMALNYSGDGLVVEDRADDHIGERVPIPNPRMVISNPGNPRRMARMNGYRGFGQMETGYPDVYAPEMYQTMTQPTSPGILDSLGNAIGNVIRTIGIQAPGMITGQPTSGYYPTGYQQPSAFGGISPILLIGGGVLLFWYLSKK
jgi:hypothetical protein